MGTGAQGLEADADFLQRFRREIAGRRVPFTGSIELTRRCNLRCVHCYCGDQDSIREAQGEELSRDRWMSLLDELAEAGCLDLLFSGGEPMLRRDFPALFAHAKKLGMIVTVFCNGTLVDDRVLDVFRDLPPLLVEVSLYGAAVETHERVTQSPGSYRRMREGVDRLLAAGLRVGLKTVLMTINRAEYAAMERLADSLGVSWRSDSALFPCLPNQDSGARPNVCGSCSGASSVLDYRVPEDEAAALECSRASRTDALRKAWESTSRPVTDALYTCGSGLTGFHLDPYGGLQPCLMATGYRESAVELGFAEAWRRIARIREVRAPEGYACNRCDLQPLCSGCPALFDLENGNPAVRSEYICSLAQQRFARVSNGQQTAVLSR
ncbi:MAG: Antilisterial bacteriocin subtilosin biosynthesis protein AlbA [Verrucomicrobia bacterium ADurb.Bin345]|nr:MAG: Antilisterial bacteriocin subtilosin biosynthesis protein AlbA [Verrucomicrobia bacterium ADurb.Bin345]